MALENGLIVPVIRNADEKSVDRPATLGRGSGGARPFAASASWMRGREGTFSITNFGSCGSVFASPVINQPQVAILGVGTVEKQPVVIDDAIAIRSIVVPRVDVRLHRLIDGALADQFTGKIKSILEGWSEEVS